MKHKFWIAFGSLFTAGFIAILYLQSQGAECLNCARLGV